MNDYGRKSKVAWVEEIYFFIEYLGLFIKYNDEVNLNINGGGWEDFFFPWSLTLQTLLLVLWVFLIFWALLYIIIIEGKDCIMYEFIYLFIFELFFIMVEEKEMSIVNYYNRKEVQKCWWTSLTLLLHAMFLF